MKKILTILFIFCFYSSFSQPVSIRSTGGVTPLDSNLFVGKSFKVPVFPDTITANTYKTLDSAGKIIFTRNTNWFWGRQTTPARRWVQLNNSAVTQLTPTCGYPNGTHIVTWDSLLTFDVTGGPYVICCDGIPRSTNFTRVILDSNNTNNPRYDLIVLDTTGIEVVKGTPAPNPATPQTDSCQIILTYVLINAHQNIPANIVPNVNPLILHDENYNTEWTIDSIRNISLDTTNTDFPVHLLKDIKVSSFSISNEFFLTSSTTIDLNNYAALKYYAKRIAFTTGLELTLEWFLGNVQQTLPATFTIVPSTGYQIFVIPLSTFRFIGTSTQANRLKVSIGGSGQVFYIDWIQLQSGTIISNEGGIGTVTSVGAGNLTDLFNTTVTNPNINPLINFTKATVPAYKVYGNNTNTTAVMSPITLDLGTPIVTGLLPIANIATGANGSFLSTQSGINVWALPPTDTIFVSPPLKLKAAGINDTISIHLIAGPGITLDSTSDGTKISVSGGTPNLQQVTDVGYTTTNTILASNYIETQSNAGLDFNIDVSGKLIATGYGGVIHFNQSTGEMIFQSSFSSGSAGTFPSFTSPNIAIEPAGNVRLYNYGLGTFTGTPTKALQVDVNGNIIEGIPISFPNGSWKITPITATAASAISTAEGLIVFVSSTNGTFTSIGLWSFQNGAWHAL